MTMKKQLLCLWAALAALTATAQEASKSDAGNVEDRVSSLEKDVQKLKKLKISGYIQGQYQYGQEDASLKVGNKSNENDDKGFNRMGIRRGRIKFVYEEGIASGVFQLDITENGVKFKDAYINVKDPWIKSMALRAGIFDRPFGYEISYSSSRRESPERSTVFQTLFPDERDLGGMLVLQAPGSSAWSALKLEAGLFAGNGVKPETDNKKDFIGHLSFNKPLGEVVTLGAGVSYYYGKVYQGTQQVYKMDGDVFVLDDSESNLGKYAKREYMGVDAQLGISTAAGMTKLTAEYLFGQQPGTQASTKSPNSDKRPESPTYVRKFNGGYAMLVQDLGKLPVSVVAKYDWYDPNTKVKKDQIGKVDSGTGDADIAVNTIGFGAIWNMTSSLKLTAYYEVNSNEKSANLEGFDKDRKDNVFTLRMQYKF